MDADSEFRLSTRTEAERRLERLQNRVQPGAGEAGFATATFRQITADLCTAYQNLSEFLANYRTIELPDFSLVLSEAQMLRSVYAIDQPSYIRSYLDVFWKENESTQDSLRRQTLSGLIQETYSPVSGMLSSARNYTAFLLEEMRKGKLPSQNKLAKSFT